MQSVEQEKEKTRPNKKLTSTKKILANSATLSKVLSIQLMQSYFRTVPKTHKAEASFRPIAASHCTANGRQKFGSC